jgi:hypothetical protein
VLYPIELLPVVLFVFPAAVIATAVPWVLVAVFVAS